MHEPLYLAAEQLVALAKQRNIRICTAESCTGGGISSTITRIPGASHVFFGSIVAYNAEIKREILKVPVDLLIQYDSVHPMIAKAMAQNALALFKSDLSVGVTGFVGPTGGTTEYPIGTVFTAFEGSINQQNISRIVRLDLNGKRSEMIEQVVLLTLQFLLEICS